MDVGGDAAELPKISARRSWVAGTAGAPLGVGALEISSPRRSASLPGATEPTGLFSLTIQGVSFENNVKQSVSSPTDTENGSLEFRSGHVLKNAGPDFPEIVKTRKLDRALLNLQL